MYVYLIRLRNSHLCKIGIAADPGKRIASIQTANPFLIEPIVVANVRNAPRCERQLHGLFAKNHYRGEWFRLGDDDIAAATTYLRIASKGMPQQGLAEATKTELDSLAEGPDCECDWEDTYWKEIHRQRDIDTQRRRR